MAGSGSPPNPPPATIPIPSHPSHAELIESHLRPRVLSGEKAGEFTFIHEADPYSVAPGVLTGRFPSVTASDGREAWYFVTKLRRKGNYQDRWNRTVETGEGTWCGNKSVDTVLSGDGTPIGRCRTFSFATMEGRKQVRSGWIMVELRLNTLDPNALCKVYRNPKAHAPAEPVEVEAPAEAVEVEAPGVHGMAGSPIKPPPVPISSHPTAEKLIESYLRPRVRSGEKPGEFTFIHEADLYAKAPGELTRQLPAATASDGREAWYFFTKLRFKGDCTDRVTRAVDTREGTWCNDKKPPQPVHSGDGLLIGQRQTFFFARKGPNRVVHLGWGMVELRLSASDPNALCKLYRTKKAKADGGSPVAAMAGAPGSKEADDEASTAAAGVAVPRRDEDDEEIDAEAVDTGLRLKRKAGDKDSGAETAAASPGREKAAVGDSADAAATGEFCVDAAQEEAPAPAEPEEPDDPSKREFYTFL